MLNANGVAVLGRRQKAIAAFVIAGLAELSVVPPSLAQSISQQLAIISDNGKCNPPDEIRPPNQVQHGATVTRQNEFQGDQQTWKFVETITKRTNDKTFNHIYTSQSQYRYIDTDRTKVDGGSLTIYCLSNDKCFQYSDRYTNPDDKVWNEEGYLSDQEYRFCSQDAASKVANALAAIVSTAREASKICLAATNDEANDLNVGQVYVTGDIKFRIDDPPKSAKVAVKSNLAGCAGTFSNSQGVTSFACKDDVSCPGHEIMVRCQSFSHVSSNWWCNFSKF